MVLEISYFLIFLCRECDIYLLLCFSFKNDYYVLEIYLCYFIFYIKFKGYYFKINDVIVYFFNKFILRVLLFNKEGIFLLILR